MFIIKYIASSQQTYSCSVVILDHTTLLSMSRTALWLATLFLLSSEHVQLSP